jgi:hypothetical protein
MGMTSELAEKIVDQIFNVNTYCAICRITEGQRSLLKRKGFTANAIVRRLSVDHIDADRSNNKEENLRILCMHCNVTRGHAYLTDEQVLAKAIRYWEQRIPNKWMWWAPFIIRQKGMNALPTCT